MYFISSVSLRTSRSASVPRVLGQETLTTTQPNFTTKDISVCKFTGAKNFWKRSLLFVTCFIFYSTFVTHPLCFVSMKKTFHLPCSNDPSSSVVVPGRRRAGPSSHQTRSFSVQWETLWTVLEAFWSVHPLFAALLLQGIWSEDDGWSVKRDETWRVHTAAEWDSEK